MAYLIWNKCCLCVPLRVGCLIIGYIVVTLKTIMFFISCINFMLFCEAAKHPGVVTSDFSFMRAVNVVYMIIQLVELMLAIVLLEGLHKNIPEKIKAFIVGAPIAYTVYLILFFVTLAKFASTYTSTEWGFSASEIIFSALYVYFILVLRSYYHKMTNGHTAHLQDVM